MKKHVIEALTEMRRMDQICVDEYEAIRHFLTPFDGQPITKQLQKKMPAGWKLEFTPMLIEIHIAATGHNHLIGYTSDPVVKLSELERFDGMYAIGNRKRLETTIQILEDQQKLKLVTRKMKQLTAFQEKLTVLSMELGDIGLDSWYDKPCKHILTMAGMPSSGISFSLK